MAKKKIPGVIRLQNAVFYAYHGVFSDEQSLGGKFEVDVDLHCDLTKSTKSDRLQDTIDYERVYGTIRTCVMEKKHFLVESLAGTICSQILKEFKLVQAVTIRVRKPSAPIKGVVDSVEVELTQSRK